MGRRVKFRVTKNQLGFTRGKTYNAILIEAGQSLAGSLYELGKVYPPDAVASAQTVALENDAQWPCDFHTGKHNWFIVEEL